MKVRKKIIVPILAIVGVTALGVGATYALFTSKDEANVAVTAGKVKLTAEADPASLCVYSASTTKTIIDGDLIAGSEEINVNDTRWATSGQEDYKATYYYAKQTTAYAGADGNGYLFANEGHVAFNTADHKIALDRMSGGDRAVFSINVTNDSNVNIKYRLRFALNEDPALYDAQHTLADAQAFAAKLKYSWGDSSYSSWHEWSAKSVIRTKTCYFDFELPILEDAAVQDKLAYFVFSVEAVQANAYTADPVEPMETAEQKVEDATQTTVISTPTASVAVPAGTVPTGTVLHLEVEPNIEGGVKVEVPVGSGTKLYEVSLVDQDGTKVTTPAGDLFLCSLDIGFVQLTGLYHKGVAMTAVAALADLDQEGEFFYDADNGVAYFLTSSFSPFQAIYNFAGGIGTQEHPFLIGNEDHLTAISDIYGTSTADYGVSKNADKHYYFKQTGNITLTKNGPAFAGSFDGNGYEIHAKNCQSYFRLFSGTSGNVEIKNLNIYQPQNGLIVVVWMVWNVDSVTFDNINVYNEVGTTMCNHANGNMGILCINDMSSETRSVSSTRIITAKNITNYANFTSSGTCGGIFFAKIYCPYDDVCITKVNMTNCINYGNLTTNHWAGVVEGNPQYSWVSNMNPIYAPYYSSEEGLRELVSLTNVKNYGIISAKEDSDAKNGPFAYVDNGDIHGKLNNIYKDDVGGEYVKSTALTGVSNVYNDNGVIKVEGTNANVVTYRVNFHIDCLNMAGDTYCNTASFTFDAAKGVGTTKATELTYHVYDYATAQANSIPVDELTYNISLHCAGLNGAYYQVGNEVYIVIENDPVVTTTDSTVGGITVIGYDANGNSLGCVDIH